MAEKVNLQKKIQEYRQTNPKLKNLSDEKVLSIMISNGVISLSEDQKRSVFASDKAQNNNMGLQVEKSAQNLTPKKRYTFNQEEKLFTLNPQTVNLH